ncbi:MAG: hypothetical protein JKY48_15360 [Flavobacteriales bacterium]|nr:hypothetical protein [Flavobacteriales bacterium]
MKNPANTSLTKLNLSLLKFGTLQSIIMSIYHFYIPFQFNWSIYLKQESPTINWSLFSLNNYFSFNLLILSLFLAFYILKRPNKKEVISVLSLLLLLFWFFSILYQLISPMPLPESLKWIETVLIGVATINGITFLIPTTSLLKNK